MFRVQWQSEECHHRVLCAEPWSVKQAPTGIFMSKLGFTASGSAVWQGVGMESDWW